MTLCDACSKQVEDVKQRLLPAKWPSDYRRLFIDCDLALHPVSQALDLLQWEPYQSPAVLSVHPALFVEAMAIVDAYRGELKLRMTRDFPDADHWLITWNGDHAGSPGA